MSDRLHIRTASVVALAATAMLALGGCIDYLDPGTFGTPRYLGDVRGGSPLPLLPPMTDRDGNTYVLYGNDQMRLTDSYIGLAGGGWSRGCGGHRGDRHGVHGWIGRNHDRAWYWTGDALVMISASSNGCRILERDPSSNATLVFLGIAPIVKDTPSRTKTVAILQATGDRRPYRALVDLYRSAYYQAEPFSPAEAKDVTVLGTGAHVPRGISFFLVKYEFEERQVVEAIYVNLDNEIIHRMEIPGLEDAEPYAVQSFLQSVNGNLAVGLLRDGRMVAFDRTGSKIVPPPADMTPVGIHPVGERLYMVGYNDDGPMLADIDNLGNLGPARLWEASLLAYRALEGHHLNVADDRSSPMREVVWSSPVSAIGPYPFLSAHTPERYAKDTTSWLIAGPGFSAGGGAMTSIALIPMGIEYR